MKVLQIISSLGTGGAEKLILDSVPLYQNKLDVDVISLSKCKTPFWEQLEEKGCGTIIGLTSKSIYNPLLVFQIIPFLKKYDIVHLHLFPTLYWVVLAKYISFSNVKLIYTEHSTSNRRRSKLIFKFLDRIFYKKLDRIICITEGVKDNLIKHLGFNENISVINNGVDLHKFKKVSINDYFDFCKKDDFKLIQISSFREQKDQMTLIKSLKFLPENVKLILVGDGQLIEANKKLVIELSLQSRVVFLGNRYDIPELINYSDVVILSSVWEGFGLAIVEGMASNKPVIASNIEGIKDIVEGYGLLFTKKDSKDLALKINKLMTNSEFYNSIAELCYQRSNDFDINVMIDNYIRIYKSVLKN